MIFLERRRLSRLGDQIQEEVSDIIRRRLKDPRVGFVSVTGARVTADLSLAYVYISVMGSEEDITRSYECLVGAARFIRTELGRRLRIKRVPEIRFLYDDSTARGARIESILRHLKESSDE